MNFGVTRQKSAWLLMLLFSISFIAASCKYDSQILAEWKGGFVTRGELRNASRLAAGPYTPEVQVRIVSDLAFLKITATESESTGKLEDEKFQKEKSLLERLAFVGAIEQELVKIRLKKKFRMMEIQGAFLNDSAPTKQREAEAEDLAKRLNAASFEEIESLTSEKTEMKLYSVRGGYIDPICTNCVISPYIFLTNTLRKAEGKFVVVEEGGGFWIARKIKEEEYSSDSLTDFYKEYTRKISRIGLKAVAKMADDQEKKTFESVIPQKNKIEETARQQADAQIARESKSLLQKRISEAKISAHFESGQVWKDALANKEIPADALLFKIRDKSYTLRDFDGQIASDSKRKGIQLQQCLLPYELLRDDELANQARESSYYKFLIEWMWNNQLANNYMKKREIGFENPGQLLKRVQGELSQKYDLKIYSEKLKGDL